MNIDINTKNTSEARTEEENAEILPEELENAPPELSEEVYKVLKEDLDAITKKKSINPHEIQNGLRDINFHKEYPDIYKIIDDMCLEYDLQGKEMTSDQILNFITEKMGDNKTRKGLNNIFDSLKDQKTGEITPEVLAKIAAEVGDELSEADLKKILQTISGPSPSININQDEFYYIMTKKPEDAFKINMATKKSS